jgi:hypothetical protein
MRKISSGLSIAKGPRGGLADGGEGEKSRPKGTLLVIHRLVRLLPGVG